MGRDTAKTVSRGETVRLGWSLKISTVADDSKKVAKVNLKRGSWIFVDHRGKRKAKCIGVSKSAAEHVAGKIEAALKLGDVGILHEWPARPFDTYFHHWLNTYVKAHCKESTLDRYQRAFRLSFFPAFGQKDLAAISRENVKGLVYEMLAAGQSRSTINAALTPRLRQGAAWTPQH